MHIKNQVVLVTGGARGLGLAITHALINEGARVVVNYLNSQAAAQTLAQQYPEQVFIYQADVTDNAQVKSMFDASFQHFGQHINAVINNALIQFEFNGEARPKVHELRWETMQQQFEGAVKAALNTTQAALEGMKQGQFGRIVNIGTNLVQNPVVPYHDYTTAKAALLHLPVPQRMNLVNTALISICSLAVYYKPPMPAKVHPMKFLITSRVQHHCVV